MIKKFCVLYILERIRFPKSLLFLLQIFHYLWYTSDKITVNKKYQIYSTPVVSFPLDLQKKSVSLFELQLLSLLLVEEYFLYLCSSYNLTM